LETSAKFEKLIHNFLNRNHTVNNLDTRFFCIWKNS